ncbi:hypothetical protein ACP70R_012101 [Stipagrostis hirtigluma subsp. patula]
METELAALPEDALADVLRALPSRSLAAARCVCKPWRDVVDTRGLLLPHILPHSVRGLFINYVDYDRPHLFARPSSPSTIPKIDGRMRFVPKELREWWSVLDHCNGLLLCHMELMKIELCVCNPATRRWTLLPWRTVARRYEGAYLAFDPVVSPYYEVFLIPDERKKSEPLYRRRRVAEEERARLRQQELDAPFCVDWFFSLPEGTAMGVDKEPDHDDPCNSPTEWPPKLWRLDVLSSRTSLWEDRSFVPEDEQAAGIVQTMELDPLEHSPWLGKRYAVYRLGNLYVCCRGGFVTRFSLSNHKYKVIQMPANITDQVPYLGKSEKGVCFGIPHECKLWVWILNESCGQLEWVLNCKGDLRHYAQHVGIYSGLVDASWTLEEHNTNVCGTGDIVKTLPKESSEWDSDNDDTFEVKVGSEEYLVTRFKILGFHPYKDVVFLAESFTVVAYHLNNSKIQYLGEAQPEGYCGWTSGTGGSFVYTPCMIGELNDDDTGRSSS